ncbi:hypothetical protein KC320_g5582 [Hortaea werneckii]|nr:hypothetical protein KC320_g5582 [Hortaea werneckii]
MPRRRRPPRPGALADLAPLRILTQIAVLQTCYYAIALVLIVFTAFVAGQHPNPGLLLDWRNVRSDVTTGWTLALCWGLDGLMMVIPILLLIARSKLVLDFALTIHTLHLIVTSLYTHAIPNTLYWWFIQACSAAIMTGLGVWACQWRELRPMAFGGKGKQRAENGHSSGASAEEGEGHAMLGGRGREEDGNDSYEMVGMGSRESG